jgi:hypothetical protein
VGEDSKKDVRENVQEFREIVLAVRYSQQQAVCENSEEDVREDVQEFKEIFLVVQVLSAAGGG